MNTRTKPQPVLILGAVTTFLTGVFGGLTTVAGLQKNATLAVVCGVGMVVTAAINQAKDFYVRGIVVPVADTAAYRDESGAMVAGPAAAQADGEPVAVLPANAVAQGTIAAAAIKDSSYEGEATP